jgi:beta-lactamase class D
MPGDFVIEKTLWKNKIKLLTALFILLFSFRTHALEWENRAELEQLFALAKVQGTFVVLDVKANRLIGHDESRAKQRFTPASTFKIPNTLIGLATGAMPSVDEVLPYGGKLQRNKAWEQDMSLREAIKISNVPIYKALARRIGKDRMQESVNALDYGNKQIGDVIDNFWLVGPLAISAVEQTQFLARLQTINYLFPNQRCNKRETSRYKNKIKMGPCMQKRAGSMSRSISAGGSAGCGKRIGSTHSL